MPSLARLARSLLPLLLLLALLLLYSHWEELGGELAAIYRHLLPLPLPPSPTWSLTLAALPSLPPLPSPPASPPPPSCHLPSMDPWHPDILPYVSHSPKVVCSDSQKSLLYTRYKYIHWSH